MTTHWKARFLTLAAAGLLAGCQGSQKPTVFHGEKFQPEDEPHASQNVLAAQAAAGARQDATLHPCHFGAQGLNSLGQEKLDLMIDAGEPSSPLVVYLDLPQDLAVAPARASVMDYLKSRGLGESQIRLEDGSNPHSTHSAADTLTQLQNMQSQGQQGQTNQQQYQQGQQPPPGPGLPGMPGATGSSDSQSK
ncbi:MAG TPA: hypothetical protein VN541_15750 [Tepidisphaeraceae bacterium]|nr:hypothetical protein [Tepidisphaeraceae bacterium]